MVKKKNIHNVMDNIRLRNYRCFEDTGNVSIKPITVLVGANSSGKSSFLKFFALLKQSVPTFVQGIFLWSGPLVDFRDFENTVNTGQKVIEVEFTIDTLPIYSSFRFSDLKVEDVRVHLFIEQVGDGYEDYLKELQLDFGHNTISLLFNSDRTANVCVNAVNSNELNDTLKWGITNSLFPKVEFKSEEGSSRREGEHSYHAYKKISDILKQFVSADSPMARGAFTGARFRNSFNSTLMNKILKRYTNNKIDDTSLEDITNLMMYYNVNILLDSLNLYMLSFAKKMTYVMPLRAITQRYYRYNNYSVDSIDADGANLPMFFNSLSGKTFQEFNERWLLPIFGFMIDLRTSGQGHVELIVKEKGKQERNLVDVGFGYTQALPILAIIWKSIVIDCVHCDESDDYCKTHIVAIEQPELHLHPRFQGMFVDMLDKVVEICHKEGKDVRIIIETHSETIVNRLGAKIMDEESYLKSSDVNVLLFNAQGEGMDKYVVSATYDEDGYLKNWPFGFFSDYVDRN